MTSDESPPANLGRRSINRVGGWSDYLEWANHDFRDRTAADEAGPPDRDPPVVEILTEFTPITVPAEFTRDTGQPRVVCRLLPPPWITGTDTRTDCEEFDETGVDSEIEAAPLRPYVRSAGQAEAVHDLQLETVLTATGLHENWVDGPKLDVEQQRICELCISPQSMAEIASAIKAPFGVAKILVSNTIDYGLLIVHPTYDDRPPVELLRRVQACLVRIS
jgi:hypothetical protein